MSETKEYSKETLRLQILDSANKPISEAEVTLTGIIKGIKQYTIILDKKTNSKGEIIKNITDIFPSPVSSFEIDINHKDYYPKPRDNYRRICRSYEYGHPCAAKFNAKTPKFAIKQVDIINNIKNIDGISIAKNFYESGSIIELKAIYDKKDIKPSQIKWAYKIILQEFKETSQAYTNPTQDTQNKKSESELICAIQKHQANQTIFDKINIANIYPINKDKTFSNKMIYFSDNNDKSHNATTQNPQIQTSNIYTGETLAITIPDKIHNKSTKFATLIIFAYVHKPHYKVAQIIRLDDYPQITIDCTLAETLRANAKNDKISTLGWGVSYICQRLWHDNPSEAKTIDDLLYKGSRNINFLNSIPNKTVRKLVAETLPRVELKEFALNGNATQRIKSHIQDDKDKNLRFYIELDWEEFYMQFPLMRELEKEFLNINSLFNDSKKFQQEFEYFYRQKMKMGQINYDIQPSKEYKISLNIQEMQKGETSNIKVFDIYDDKVSIPQGNIAIDKLDKPSQIISNKIYFQRFGVDMDIFLPHFGLSKIDAFPLSKSPIQHKNAILNKFNRIDKHRQNFALYSMAGNFNIVYIFDGVTKNKKKPDDICFVPKNIRAFIVDGVDFNNKIDNNGKEKDQPIGVWDYRNICFDLYYSVLQYRQNRIFNSSPKLPMSSIFFLYNSDFIQTKYHFALGLDFFIYTKSFYDIKQGDE